MTAATATRPSLRDDLRVPLMAVALLTVLRVLYLEYTPLGLYADEAQYWLWSRVLEAGYFSKPPLIAWVIAGATGLCGNGEACVRVASPLFHGATAVVVALIGRDLGGRRLAFWTSLTYATLPGVFYSATLITTDVPLLFFWALLLWATMRLIATDAWRWAVVAGVAGGLGFLSKYAMLFALPGIAAYLLWVPRTRTASTIGRLAVAGAIAAVIALPNILWNAGNGFATVRHTAELAVLDRPPLSVVSLAEFLANQVAIFGVVLTAALAWRLYDWRRFPGDDRERLLIAFALPVLLAMIGQSLVSQAYGNWAAVAYVPLTVVVAGWLLQRAKVDWLVASLALHIFLAVVGGGALVADTLWRRSGGCGIAALDRHLRWDIVGDEVATRLVADPQFKLLSDDRDALASIVYYARLWQRGFAKWSPPEATADYYAETGGLAAGDPGPWLFASVDRDATAITSRFEKVTPAGRLTIPLSVCRARRVNFFELEGFRGY